MLFQQPAESPYDLRFECFGFPTRIAWSFWLIAVVLGYDQSRWLDQQFGVASPGSIPLLMIWGGCILMSILIHELGHALAFRRFGIESSILLYHFGGLAIPSSLRRGGRGIGFAGRLTPSQELIIALAGPALQIGVAIIVCVLVRQLGYRVEMMGFLPGPLGQLSGESEGEPFESAALFAGVNFFVLPSIMWGLMNLVPVLPLDGGKIAQSAIAIFGGNAQQAYWLSVIAAAIIALYAFNTGQTFLGIFFIWIAIDNYQATQMGRWR